ncbi:hypothetical protein BSKO_11924 [Bryopsis sp. KO-2023]|nr:hypothetical protein BSKO_11924 [Bryopsis sp. KO-2023]
MDRPILLLLVAAVTLSLAFSASAEWDYIVVGAGASGCIVAPELAKSGKRVLLLEGGPPTAWDFGGREQEDFYNSVSGNKDLTVFDMPGENERIRQTDRFWWSSVPWARVGKGVGGSGMMNGALTFTPSPQDLDSWPAGWKFNDLQPYFDETFAKLSLTSTPSADGELYAQGAGEAYARMCTNQLGMRQVDLNANPNDRTNTFSITEVSAKGGQRMDACLAYLLPAMNSLSNLELMTDAEVTHIKFAGGLPKGRAEAVVLKDGREMLLNPQGKVVLTAGTFHTTKLLLTSGIGPRSVISKLSIDDLVLNDPTDWVTNDFVGKAMHDHTFTLMTFKVPDVPDFAFRYYVKEYVPEALKDYFSGRTNAYAQYGPLRIGFIGRDLKAPPEVEMLGMSSGEEGSADKDCPTCFRILLMLLHPKALTDFELMTRSGCDCGGAACKIGDVCKPNLYLANQEDVATMKWAVETVGKAAQAEGYTVLTPSSLDSAALDAHLKSAVGTLPANHYSGTCALGKCTNTDLKVEGTQNVYVADSSVFPTSVRAHNVGTVYGVARKAADHISQTSA